MTSDVFQRASPVPKAEAADHEVLSTSGQCAALANEEYPALL
jgi:hypothetical protein